MSWFKKSINKSVEKEVVVPTAPVQEESSPLPVYPKNRYWAYVESVPNLDGSFTVRFYHRKESRILEEHVIIGEFAVKKLIREYMPKYEVK